MAIQMTREQYESIYGSKPVLSNKSVLDDEKPAPIQMTRQEYEEKYYPEKKRSSIAKETAGDVGEMYQGLGESFGRAYEGSRDIIKDKEYNPLQKTMGVMGKVAGGVSSMIGDAFIGGLKVLSPQSLEDSVKESLAKKVEDVKGTDVFNKAKDWYEGLDKDSKLVVDSAGGVASFMADVYAPGVAKSVAKPVQEGLASAKQLGKEAIAPVVKSLDERGVNNVIKELETIENKYVKTRNANTFSKDIDASSRRIAESNVLDGAVDTDGVIRTKVDGGAIDQYKKQTIDGFEDTVRKALKESKETIPFDDVRKALVREIGKAGLEGADLVSALKAIEKELKGLAIRTKGSSIIDLLYLHDAKLATTRNINYLTPPEKATYRKAVARAYKTLVEDNSKKVAVKEINEKLAMFYEDIARLERLDGARAEGGRLGKYTASLAGTLIGGAAGSAGGSVGAAIGGVIGGEAGQALKGAGMARTFKGGGKGLAKDPTLVRAKLSIPDNVVRANKNVPRTKEVKKLESKIAKNVADQKKAIAKKDFTLVAALKEVYAVLVEEWHKVIKYLNEHGSIGLAIKKVDDDSTLTAAGRANKALAKGTPDADLKTNREVAMKDVAGNKFTVPSNTVIKPLLNEKGQAIITVDGKSYTVPKNQYDNLKGQSTRAIASEFAPELKGTVETVKGNAIKNKEITDYNIIEAGTGRVHTYASMDFAKKAVAEKYPGAKIEVKKYKKDVLSAEDKTKYSQYTLDGGENYREILIQAPSRDNSAYVMVNKGSGKPIAEYANLKEAQTALSQQGNKTSYYIEPKGGGISEYKSSHWSEPNVISHIRMNERTVDGKKYAFMEELQSDWARDGRDKGFIDEAQQKFTSLPTGYTVKTRKIPEGVGVINGGKDRYWVESPNGERVSGVANNGEHWDKQDAIDAALRNFNKYGAVPNNPLLKNWQIPTTKRALIEAVDSGADRFAWINGEQTSARYNLATHVDEVKWFDPSTAQTGRKSIVLQPKSGGKRMEFEVGKDGSITQIEDGVPSDWKGKKLDEVLGKGLADKIMEKETGTLSGDGLSFGGEWAKNLYDRQVRDIVKKLTGAEVKTVDMGLTLPSKWDRFTFADGNDAGGFIRPNQLKKGLNVTDKNGTEFTVTEVMADGDFLAFPKRQIDDYKVVKAEFSDKFKVKVDSKTFDSMAEAKKHAENLINRSSRKFTLEDDGPTTQLQQYIELTPEVKAKIQSKTPSFKMKDGMNVMMPLILAYFYERETN